jgi:hypothetical protein
MAHLQITTWRQGMREKKLQKVLIVFPVLIYISFIGCSQPSWDQNRLEDTLTQGIWTVSSYIRGEGGGREEDITDDFEGYQLSFIKDGTLEVVGPLAAKGRWSASSDELRIDIDYVVGGPFHLLASLWFFYGRASSQDKITLFADEISYRYVVVRIPVTMRLARLS